MQPRRIIRESFEFLVFNVFDTSQHLYRPIQTGKRCGVQAAKFDASRLTGSHTMFAQVEKFRWSNSLANSLANSLIVNIKWISRSSGWNTREIRGNTSTNNVEFARVWQNIAKCALQRYFQESLIPVSAVLAVPIRSSSISLLGTPNLQSENAKGAFVSAFTWWTSQTRLQTPLWPTLGITLICN